MKTSNTIKKIMNEINTVYVDESPLNQSVKKSLSKLNQGELGRLLVMIETSK